VNTNFPSTADIRGLAAQLGEVALARRVTLATAAAMAQGARALSGVQWAVAVTGIAGPAGGSPAKPVGTVWFAWAGPEGATTLHRRLDGDRSAVRAAAVAIALEGLIDRLT
jgi:nicotinamide-nucleotide amidase